MKKTLQLGLLLLGALALSFTLATADGKCGEGKCGDAKKAMKCNSGKYGTDGNKTGKKCSADGNSANAEKKVPTKGKCGQGKCG